MKARDRQKATSAAVRARIYPLFRALGYRRIRNGFPGPEDEFPLAWQRRRDGYLDQIEVWWSKGWDARFCIEWMTGDLRRLSPAHRGSMTGAGRGLRGPGRMFSLSDSSGEWFKWRRDLNKEMDLVEMRVRQLDDYLKYGTPMNFMDLPSTLPMRTDRICALDEAAKQAERAEPWWWLRAIFKRQGWH